MTLPLSDIRVVDFATVLAGPFAAMLLADQGAEVIKLEAPDGDSARRLVPVPGTDDLSIGFLAFNRNKRSVTLDVSTPAGREAAYRLIKWADVLIINLRVGARARHGFTYEDLAKVNPRLIYVSLTGYGDDGPEANLPGADITIQARLGDIEGRREPGQPPPAYTHLYHFDMATSMLTAFAVTLALREREKTGLGQKIETSLLQTGVSLQAIQMTRVAGFDGWYAARPTGLPQIYRCGDGRYILDQFINIGARWDRLCEALGLQELISDPRFATQPGREQHLAEIEEILTRNFLTQPAAEWERRFKAAAHTNSIVKDIDEVFDDVQVVANQMVTAFHQPGVGEVKAVSLPFRMSSSTGEPWLRRPVPRKGEHTDEVLAEMGYSPAEIAALRSGGATG